MLVVQLRKADVVKFSMTSWTNAVFISHYQLFQSVKKNACYISECTSPAQSPAPRAAVATATTTTSRGSLRLIRRPDCGREERRVCAQSALEDEVDQKTIWLSPHSLN